MFRFVEDLSANGTFVNSELMGKSSVSLSLDFDDRYGNNNKVEQSFIFSLNIIGKGRFVVLQHGDVISLVKKDYKGGFVNQHV